MQVLLLPYKISIEYLAIDSDHWLLNHILLHAVDQLFGEPERSGSNQIDPIGRNRWHLKER